MGQYESELLFFSPRKTSKDEKIHHSCPLKLIMKIRAKDSTDYLMWHHFHIYKDLEMLLSER